MLLRYSRCVTYPTSVLPQACAANQHSKRYDLVTRTATLEHLSSPTRELDRFDESLCPTWAQRRHESFPRHREGLIR